jgi:capsular polysaccharide transport system ATP-binding protein
MGGTVDQRLIHLIGVTKTYTVENASPKLVLRPTTLTIPTDRRIAVLGRRRSGKSTILKLLAGNESPSEGEIFSRVRISSVVRPGSLFHPRLNNQENLRFYARTLNVDMEELMAAVGSYSTVSTNRGTNRRGENTEQRKAIEVALLTLQCFGCYLVDEIAHLADDVRHRLLYAAAQQGAGVIFSTNLPQMARRYAEGAIVIREGIVRPFASIERAIQFHER